MTSRYEVVTDRSDCFRFLLGNLLWLLFSACALADANLGLPPLPVPSNNWQTTEKISLGQRLFNDKRFSADGSISCASCHQPEKAFTDGLVVAAGLHNQQGSRNTPTLINAAFYEALFLDGRATSLEEQVPGPLVNPKEHGLTSLHSLIDIIQHDATYPVQFKHAFAIAANDITSTHITQAIASYERTLIAGNSPFDRYLFGRNHTELSASAERGLALFKDKGHCVTCHEISWNNALFTDNRFYNIGVGFKHLAPVLERFIRFVSQGKNPDAFPLTEQQRAELGRYNVTKDLADIGKFKTPTLRNISLTAPYMHDGRMKTLAEVIEHYDQGGDPEQNSKNHFIDTKIFPLHLTQQEKTDLLVFMQALTSPHYLQTYQAK